MPHGAMEPLGLTSSPRGAVGPASMLQAQRQAPTHPHMHTAPPSYVCPLFTQPPGDHWLWHEGMMTTWALLIA